MGIVYIEVIVTGDDIEEASLHETVQIKAVVNLENKSKSEKKVE